MNPFVVRMLFVFILIFVSNSIRLFWARKLIKNKVEIPGKGQRIGLGVIVAVTVLIALLALLSLSMKDTEMTVVCSIITFVFSTLIYFIRRKYKRMYEETEDYFILRGEYRPYQVYYENITDWMLLPKQIGIMDKSREGNYYICVNLTFSKPEILLRKLAEMTFSGKLKDMDSDQTDSSNREQELVDHLRKNGYGYIVKDYLVE